MRLSQKKKIRKEKERACIKGEKERKRSEAGAGAGGGRAGAWGGAGSGLGRRLSLRLPWDRAGCRSIGDILVEDARRGTQVAPWLLSHDRRSARGRTRKR